MQINGGTQVQANTLTSGQVNSSILVASGANALTGNLSAGSNKITNLATPTSSTDAATKGYVDTAIQGLSGKYSAVAGTNTETLTISSGSVTQISGTTVNSVSPNVNDYILIMNAPASSGAAGGTTMSAQPANGLYVVTSNTTNLSVSRASDMNSGTPAGAYVFVDGGSVWGGGGYVVTTPSTTAAFTYGTGNIQFTQFSGAGEITTDSTLTKSGNQLSRAAITGAVSISAGSNSATLASSIVGLSNLANLAANSVIANVTGSSATPTAVSLLSTATASSVALRDANANLFANSVIESSATTTTAGGTTTLTVSSSGFQQFTGSTTQTVVLPNATTMSNGQSFWITNRSSGAVTVNMNGGSLLQTMAAGSFALFTLVNNGTSAGTWDNGYIFAGGTGTVTSVSVVSANGFAGTVANSTSTPAITISTSVSGILKGNGTSISAATAGTDYMAPADFVTRETPSGTVNGSNTSFSLANTPISGTEQVYQNGILLRAGGSYDYTISGATITMTTAPLSNDYLCVSYQK